MGQRNSIKLILILVLLVASIWIDLPGNPGIKIGEFERSLETQLGLDLRGGLRVLLEADLPEETQVSSEEMEDAKTILENRANGLGVSEVVFQVAGNRRIVAEFPGLTDTSQVVQTLKQVGQLAFVPMGQYPVEEGETIKIDYTKIGTKTGVIPDNALPESSSDGSTPEMVYSPLMSGADLDTVTVGRSQLGQYSVDFTLKETAKGMFGEYTTNHVGDYLAIVLDDKVISAPTINSAITEGQGQISGNFTQDSANDLMIQLKYGALPIPFKVVQSQAVGATLGQDSIDKSILAGSIGLLLTILFLIFSYRLPGVMASLALVIYAVFTLAIYKLLPVTLTLPGIAGFILSVGMAVDANVLIFERLKEELRAGRTIRQAIDLGWSHAWSSIKDSNVTTLISSVILFWFGNTFGASLVKGFAVTLFIGIFLSLFTAIVVTRALLHLTLDNLKIADRPWLFGV
ncbi:MAG: protein translocase subunit SecD [Leptolinea sp.]|nr:protein translocase subunit SecD [Leptolinea sp.]